MVSNTGITIVNNVSISNHNLWKILNLTNKMTMTKGLTCLSQRIATISRNLFLLPVITVNGIVWSPGHSGVDCDCSDIWVFLCDYFFSVLPFKNLNCFAVLFHSSFFLLFEIAFELLFCFFFVWGCYVKEREKEENGSVCGILFL